MNCIFCNIEQSRIIDQDAFFFVIRDGYPVTEGHSLFIPYRHALTWFDLTSEEHAALNALLTKQKKLLQEADNTITGFNIGMNCGEDAGQSVMHCHIHLIPRRKGDMEDPKGGVRGVIPHKQKY
ncbi:hypothetical protein A9Q99_19620 [Gammaproteobacteria bacterium 45_16_T64]|nr:hypothetical protein A9Q99_19620 [Gammaproteobacteria bacterium 45_16_T64]